MGSNQSKHQEISEDEDSQAEEGERCIEDKGQNPQAIEEIMNHGFSESQAMRALNFTNTHVEGAISYS